MKKLPESVLREIKDRISIVELIGHYVELKRAGRSWKGLCPFHTDSAPSFHVSEERQFFHCFGCQEHGDAISFLMKIENLSFPEAITQLAEQAGVDLPKVEMTAAEKENISTKERILDLNAKTTAFFEKCLRHPKMGKPGRDYIEKRGISEEMVESFRLGLAPEGWEELSGRMQESGVTPWLMEKAGLAIEGKRGYYDRFRQRLMFPIIMQNNKVVGFSGRALSSEESAKYINSSESEAFHKSSSFYGFHLARQAIFKAEEVIVVEGNIDVIKMHQAGFENTIATLGTALTKQHIKMLKRGAKRIILLFDGDKAGKAAMFRSLEMFLAENVNARVAMLPEEHDPDSFLSEHGKEPLEELLKNSKYLLDLWLEKHYPGPGSGPRAAAESAEVIVPMLQRIVSEVERSLYIQRVATRLGVPEVSIIQLLRQNIARRSFNRTSTENVFDSIVSVKQMFSRTEGTILLLAIFFPEQVSGTILNGNTLSMLENDSIREALELIFEAVKERRQMQAPEIIDKLTDNELRNFLAKNIMDGIPYEEEDAAQACHECLIDLQKRGLKQQIEILRQQISTMQQKGEESQDQVSLIQSRMDLERQLRQLNPEILN